MLALRRIVAERGFVRPYWERAGVRIRVAHLYPEYLNIYADRGNIAVLARRAELRGHELAVQGIGMGEPFDPEAVDLLYVGGGQDREQALVAADLAGRGEAIRSALEAGAALLAVCGGYQLLGRGYRDRSGAVLPGAGIFPLETVAGERRMIGDVLLECELVPGERRTAGRLREPCGSHAPRSRARRRSAAWSPASGTTAQSGFEGCRVGRALGTYLHGPLLPRNPWLADWLLAQALARQTGEAADARAAPGRAGAGGAPGCRGAGATPRRAVLASRGR